MLEYSDFYATEFDGKNFYSHEDLEIYMKNKREAYWNNKTWIEKIQVFFQILLQGVIFMFLILKHKIKGE
jgi:hypothetical protein